MEDLFIICTDTPVHAALSEKYQTVQAAMQRVEPAVAELKQRRGQCLPRAHSDKALGNQRARAYEVAFIKLERENASLFGSVRELYAAVKDAREMLSGSKLYLTHRGLLQNNILCAEELADSAAALYFDCKKQHIHSSSLASHCFGIERCFAAGPAVSEPREYVVMSAGHGSKFRFDEGDGTQVPAAPYLTLDEAEYECAHWVGIADTIGGDAVIYNVRTGQTQSPTYKFRQ